MNVLFIHQNFPGQYRHIAAALADDPDNTVIAVGESTNIGRLGHPRVMEIGYKAPKGAGQGTHHYLKSTEAGIRRGQQIVRVADELSAKGFTPDIVCCHPAWGEGLFLKDVWPNVPLLYFFEFFYRATGLDTNFDPEFVSPRDSIFKTRIRNSIHLQSLHQADFGVTPTQWQHSSLPDEYKEKVSIIFDGIDTQQVAADDAAQIRINDQLTLTARHEVVTFVNRNLEPYRGYHQFMRSLPELMAARPNAHFVVVGGDGVSYGPAPPAGQSYKQMFLAEVQDKIDLERLHFLGRVPYDEFLKVLQVSSVHVYLTYPFVLSWSLLEAMSAECAIVASATPPVKEIIKHDDTGLLFDFFDKDALIRQVCSVLEHPDHMAEMGSRARQHIIEHYDLKTVCLPQQLALIQKVIDHKSS